MERSGSSPPEPEVSLADAGIAAEIARVAARGRGSDRAPTLEQLLAAFGEHAPTHAARVRVRAALRVAGTGVRPDLLEAEPGQRLLLLPPAAQGPSRSRAAFGVAALIAVVVAAVAGSSLLGSGDDTQRASDDLPDGPTTSVTVPPAQTTTAGSDATPAATTTATSGAATTDTTSTTPEAEESDEPTADERRQREARARQAARAAAARRQVTVRVDASAQPTFLCADDGNGTELYAGTLSGRKTFKGLRVRLNIGLASTIVRVNGNPVRLEGSPTGLDITRAGGARVLELGSRPCG